MSSLHLPDRFHGMNLRDALCLWQRLGGRVEEVRGTGELRLVADALPGPSVRLNRRRKDCSRTVTHWLRRLASATVEVSR